MKHNLLKKILIITSLTAVVSACGGSDSDKKSTNIEPVSINGDLNIILNEDSDLHVFNLLDGVTNPADTPIFTRKFTFLNLDENEVPLYEGPALPTAAIYKRSDEMAVATQLFKDVLVHPATVAANPPTGAEDEKPLYSQGVYKFTYILDNGSNTLITRNINITVNAVEDIVTEIALSQPNGFKAPIGYSVPLKATVTPSNATFSTITWASSDTSKATVDQNGNVTGLVEGNTTITATSADGAVVASTVAEVITTPTEPVAVDVVFNSKVVSGEVTEVSLGTTATLSYDLIPVELGFTNGVEWTSSNPEAVSVNSEGEMTTLIEGEKATITATIADLTYLSQSVEIVVTPHANLFYEGDFGFESGSLAPNWAPSWNNKGIVEIREEAAMEGTYGLYIENNGEAAKFVSEPIATRDFTVDPKKFYKLSFYAKNLNGRWAGGPTYLWSNSPDWVSSNPKKDLGGNPGTWWGGASAEWAEYVIYYLGQDIIDSNVNIQDLRIFLQLQSPNTKFYLDNFSLTEVNAF